MFRPPPPASLFPYTTLFRSDPRDLAEACHENPAWVDLTLPVADLDPEDLDRAALLRQPIERRVGGPGVLVLGAVEVDRKSTRLNSSHGYNSYADFCLKKKTT